MREIVIDTETTGLDPLDGHRIVEIGAVELVDRAVTGNTLHRYLCPERAMPTDALAVHGLTAEFLADKPLFGAIADEFLAFVGDAPLVAHNAGFDSAFLNAELKRTAKLPFGTERVIDTLVLARRKHSGGPPRVSTVPGRPASGRHAPGAPSGGVTRVRGVASVLGTIGSFRPRNWVNFRCCGAAI